MITKDAEAEILVAEFSCRVNTSVSHVNRLQICSTMTSTWGSFLTKNERLGEFSHHKPPLLSNPIICSFRCKEKIKSSVEKILVAIPVVVGLRQSLKRTIPSSRFFRAFVFFFMEFLLLWCNRKCGWFSWYFGSTSKVSGECFLFIFDILVLLVYCSPISWKVGGWPPEQLAAVSQQFSGWLEVEL